MSTAMAHPTASASEAAYDLFRRAGHDDLLLAVPQRRAVPAFIDGEAWRFHRVVECAADAPPGFDRNAALQGTQLNGYYLFLTHRGARLAG